MIDIKDIHDHLVCKADELTGYIEASYRRQTTRIHLPVGESFQIERFGTVTIIIRDSPTTFKVKRLALIA